MRKVTISNLPNGAIPFEGVKNVETKRLVMLLNENLLSIKKQLVQVQKAVQELQQKER